MQPIRRFVCFPRFLSIAFVLIACFAGASLAEEAVAPANVRTVDPLLRARLPLRPAQTDLPMIDLSNAPRSVDPRLRNLGRSVVAAQHLDRGLGGEEVVSVFVRGAIATSALRALGADVESEAGEVRTARVPVSALPALVGMPGIEQLSLGYRIRPHLNVAIPDAHIDQKRPQSPPVFGWYGNNVIVGIIDTGFDYQHDDFKNPDGTTRFLSIWDQNTPGAHPAGFTYGNECTQASINSGACSEVDADGHGSHVTGIAAGDGSATGRGQPAFQYVGAANGAQIVGVATNFGSQGVVDAANYIFQKAASVGKPAVVNMSLGTNMGPHDGKTSFDKALSALTGPGKILVASAGNAQQDNAHASRNIPVANGQDTLLFNVPPFTANLGSNNDYIALDFWHASTNSYQVSVRRPSSATAVGPVNKGAASSFSTVDGNILIDYSNVSDPSGNGQSEIYVEINDLSGSEPRAGAWQVRLTGVSTPASPKVHSWMDSFLGDGSVTSQFTSDVDTTVIVASPATADSVIAVAAATTRKSWTSVDNGSYSFLGAVDPPLIAPFSARGPRRDGVAKPDITAPGTAIVSVLSTDSGAWPLPLIVKDSVHVVLQGTSMSSPEVTGAVAMLLQKTPTLRPSGVKALLAAGARSDAVTGAVPNPRWGAGRLDLASLLCTDYSLPTVTAGFPQTGDQLYQASPATLTWNAADDQAVASITLEYRIGTSGAYTLIANGEANDGSYLWTVPNLVTDSLQVRVTAFDCVDKASVSGPFVPVRAAVDTPSNLPLAFAAHRSSPNPFSKTTVIGFDLPAGSSGPWPVEVSLFNVAGRRVRTLVRGPLPPGRYSYEWDGRDDGGVFAAAGIYFLRVNAGQYSARDRLIYLP